MKNYPIPLVPGPTRVPKELREVAAEEYGSADLEEDFFQLYEETEQLLQKLLHTKNSITIHSGEGMIALWGALKSVIPKKSDDFRILSVSNGVFGTGIGDMARDIGTTVEMVEFEYDQPIDVQKVREVALKFQPHMITAVHCDTPTGVLNTLAIKELGKLCREISDDMLFYVDFVSSAGGAEVRVDDWNIDLGLLGTQKALSVEPALAMVSVSARAWKVIERVNYVGYDALLPWRDCIKKRETPYTHNWAIMAQLHKSLKNIVDNENIVLKRHASVAAYCRDRIRKMGLQLFLQQDILNSPTVTAVLVPEGWTWKELDGALRAKGLVVGGSYGKAKDRVFRIGHMGSQADMELVKKGLDVLEEVISSRP
eukprot:GEZU01011387.1.p1 GENE.GEZU01011387.1~~GEZU01011387.1.p1  ORF type:complete len:369 (+),score=66.07 GEZU01011387.1:90-1196(+)